MKGRSGTFLSILLSGFLVIGILSCDTANNVEDPRLDYFVKYYGGNGNQKGVDMLPMSDGSFLLLGNYSENNFINSDIYLVRVDLLGNVIWEKKYKGNSVLHPNPITSARDIEPTDDGNFIILSDYQPAIGAQSDLKLTKIAPDGTVLDSLVFAENNRNDFGRTVTPLNDGGFIVSGTTVPNPPLDNGDFINYRFNSEIELVSTNEWFPISPNYNGRLDVSVKAIQKPDEYYIFGYSNYSGSNNPDETLGLFYFSRDLTGGESKPNFPGNIVNVNNTEIQFVGNVATELGGGFIVIGTSINNLDVSEIFIAKLRNTLTFEDTDDVTLYNTLKFGRNIRGVSAASSINGSYGYLVLGNEVRNTGALNIWLSKIDQSGNIIWSSTFGSEAGEDSGSSVLELPDGKILVFGTMGLADNQSKMALIKLNSKGELLK